MANLPALDFPRNGKATLAPGRYGPGDYRGLHDLDLDARGVVVAGGRGRVRIEDGCRDVSITGLEVRSLWQGIWVTGSERFTFRDCHFHHNRREGFLAGACKGLHLTGCLSEFNGPAWGPDARGSGLDELNAAAEHGFYDGYGGRDGLYEDCEARDCNGCGFHSERNADDGILEHNLTLRGCRFLRCGSDGTACFQFDATAGGLIEDTLVASCNAWALLGDDGGGRKLASTGFTFRRNTVFNSAGKFNLRLAPGASGHVIEDSILVLADAPLFEVQGGGEWTGDLPRVTGCLIFAHSLDHVPASVRAANRVERIEVAAALFPQAAKDASASAYVPADAGVTQGWRPVGATPAPAPALTPPPVVIPPAPPVVPPQPSPSAMTVAALAKAEAAALALAASLAELRGALEAPAPPA